MGGEQTDSGVPVTQACCPSPTSPGRARPVRRIWTRVECPETHRTSVSPRDGSQGRFQGSGEPRVRSQGPAPLAVPPPSRAAPRALPGAGTKSSRDLPSEPGRRPRGAPPAPAPGSRRPGRERGSEPSGLRRCGPQRCLLRGGVGLGARAGGTLTRRGPPPGEERGDHCVHPASGRIGRPPLVPICRAEKLGRAGRGRCARKGGPTPFSPRARASPLPPSPLSARGLSGSGARVCPPPSPVLDPLRQPPFLPFLFSPLWMGDHRLQLPRRREPRPPRFCDRRPSQQRTGRSPAAVPGARPRPSLAIARCLCVPLPPPGPKLCPKVVDSFAVSRPAAKRESCKPAFL